MREETPRRAPVAPTEVLFELHYEAWGTRVIAIDPISNTEVTMVGAPGYSKEMLTRLAARKLAYVLAKNARATNALKA